MNSRNCFGIVVTSIVCFAPLRPAAVNGGELLLWEKWCAANSDLRQLGGSILIEPIDANNRSVILRWEPNSIDYEAIPPREWPDLTHLRLNRIEILTSVIPTELCARLSQLNTQLEKLRIESDHLTNKEIQVVLKAINTKVRCLQLSGRGVTPDLLPLISRDTFEYVMVVGPKRQLDQFSRFVGDYDGPERLISIVLCCDLTIGLDD